MIHIRPLLSADAPDWTLQRIALWPDESAGDLAGEVSAYLAGGSLHLEEVLVAHDDDGVLIGFAELNRRPYAEGCTTTPVAFLEAWYVVPEHRGRGVGRALMAAAEQWGRQQGCSEFASDTTFDNTASAAAHRALGFEQVEIIRCFRKDLGGEKTESDSNSK